MSQAIKTLVVPFSARLLAWQERAFAFYMKLAPEAEHDINLVRGFGPTTSSRYPAYPSSQLFSPSDDYRRHY